MSKNTTTKIKVQELHDYQLPENPWVAAVRQGSRYVEAKYMERPCKCHVRKLSKTEYEVIKTGEIRQYAEQEEKLHSNLRAVFSTLRGLLRTNFDGGHNQVMLTLTYKENMRNVTTAYDDFEAFIKRLKRFLPDHKLDYINIIEPQRRGAWHFHTFIKSDKPQFWISKNDIKDIWGRERGNAYIERLKLSNDVGSYYVSYFTDIIGENGKEERQLETYARDSVTPSKTIAKKREKGARLKLYPKDLKFYRCSRGIIRPEKNIEKLNGLVSEFGSPIYKKTVELQKVSEGEEISKLNVISKMTFKNND